MKNSRFLYETLSHFFFFFPLYPPILSLLSTSMVLFTTQKRIVIVRIGGTLYATPVRRCRRFYSILNIIRSQGMRTFHPLMINSFFRCVVSCWFCSVDEFSFDLLTIWAKGKEFLERFVWRINVESFLHNRNSDVIDTWEFRSRSLGFQIFSLF